MKKSNIRIAFLLFTLMLLSSCADFLDKEADTEITLESVFQNKTKTQQWLAGCYSMIPDPYWGYMRDLGWEILGDDMSPSERWRNYGWQVIPFALGEWTIDSDWSPS